MYVWITYIQLSITQVWPRQGRTQYITNSQHYLISTPQKICINANGIDIKLQVKGG